MKKLSIAASQYSVSTVNDTNRDNERGSERDRDRGGRGQRAVRDSDLWVSTADISDILRLAGVSATSATIAECVDVLKRFLPGVPQGKLCFQVRERQRSCCLIQVNSILLPSSAI
jgi:hypothetical protein